MDRVPRDAPKDTAAERRLTTVRWGLVPSWAKDIAIGNRMINARIETLAEKPAFKRALKKRRCLLPADGYYEWYPTEQLGKSGKPLKQPFFIRPKDGGVMAMAGLYEIWRNKEFADDDEPGAFVWSATVITTTAEDSVGHIHDRMPMLVEPERYAAWLDATVDDPGDLATLLVPAAPGRLEAYPVAKDVNNVRNNGEHLMQPIPLGGVRRLRRARRRTAMDRTTRDHSDDPHRPRRRPDPLDRARRPVATLVLGHGAGRGEDSPDLVALAATLPRQGISVFRIEQPWHVAGKKVAARPESLDEATRRCMDAIRVRTPVILGGRSAGARVACRSPRRSGRSAASRLHFRLHPPGRPESHSAPRAARRRSPHVRGPGRARHVRGARCLPAKMSS